MNFKNKIEYALYMSYTYTCMCVYVYMHVWVHYVCKHTDTPND